MAELSKSDIDFIKTTSKLQIERERSSLQEALNSTTTDSQRTDAFPSDRDHESDLTEAEEAPNLKVAITSLLLALASHRIANKLRCKGSGRTIVGELVRVLNHLESDHIGITLFDPLIQAVVRKASDLEVWKQVLHLITSSSQLTPPPGGRVSFGGTPRTHTSASLQGSEQTARLVENALKPELQNCTFIDVDDVFEKYFDEKSWTEKSVDIYKSIKHTHTNGRWATFPSNPTESAVWSWWSSFQDELLTESRGVYYTTKSKEELKGIDNGSQLDMFIKSRKISAASAADGQVRHDWADVLVLGEHTVSTYHSGKFWQLARYARNVFSAQPRRTFVLGFILANTFMELYTFDRSGAYRSQPFDIHKEPERFIRVICGYSMMSDEELGVDTFIERDGEKTFVTVDNEDSGHGQRLELQPHPIVRRAAIVGRNTACYLAADRESVVKFSWVSASRTPTETELLRIANEKNVQGVPKLVGHRRFTSTSELRSPLKFSKKRRIRAQNELWNQRNDLSFSSQLDSLPLLDDRRKRKSDDNDRGFPKRSRSNSRASKLSQVHRAGDSFDNSQLSHASQGSQVGDEPYIDRVLCCQVTQPAGDPLTEFKTARTLLQALRDAIKAHRSLFLEGKILHRDVSASNIIITDPEVNKGLSAMLIDVELGTIVDGGNNTRTGLRQMTGTLKYMAIEVVKMGFVENKSDLEHTYRHDLESFFYVFLDMCLNHGWETGKAPRNDPLRTWYVSSDYEAMYNAKLGNMGLDGFQTLILPKFPPAFEHLKGVAISLRDLLFLRLPGGLRTGTPVGDESVLYDQMIGAFDEAIS